jgi:hypothetical protein
MKSIYSILIAVLFLALCPLANGADATLMTFTNLAPLVTEAQSLEALQAKATKSLASIVSNGIAVTGVDMSGVTVNTATNVSATMSAASLAFTSQWTNNLIVKASAGTLLTLNGYNSGPAQFIQLFNSAAVPGANTTPICVISVLETNNFSVDFNSYGLPFSTGMVAACSTVASGFTVGSTNCWFTATYR